MPSHRHPPKRNTESRSPPKPARPSSEPPHSSTPSPTNNPLAATTNQPPSHTRTPDSTHNAIPTTENAPPARTSTQGTPDSARNAAIPPENLLQVPANAFTLPLRYYGELTPKDSALGTPSTIRTPPPTRLGTGTPNASVGDENGDAFARRRVRSFERSPEEKRTISSWRRRRSQGALEEFFRERLRGEDEGEEEVVSGEKDGEGLADCEGPGEEKQGEERCHRCGLAQEHCSCETFDRKGKGPDRR